MPGGLGCACLDVLLLCLQVVVVVARSHESGAGRVPLSGQAPTSSGTSALGRVHEAGQGAGNPAASSPFPLGWAQGTSASNSPAGDAPTSKEPTCRAASSNAAAVEPSQAVQPPQALAPSSDAASAEGCHAVQSCQSRGPAGPAPSSNPTFVRNLADGQQPARLAARQAAPTELMPSTWPMFGNLSEGHADAQVGLICAVGCQGALSATPAIPLSH